MVHQPYAANKACHGKRLDPASLSRGFRRAREAAREYPEQTLYRYHQDAYRAETAMAYVLRERMARFDDAHSLIRAIYRTEVDLLPNEPQGTLTVRLHHLANDSSDEAIRHLCAELNATETPFPGTNLRLIYKLVSSQNP